MLKKIIALTLAGFSIHAAQDAKKLIFDDVTHIAGIQNIIAGYAGLDGCVGMWRGNFVTYNNLHACALSADGNYIALSAYKNRGVLLLTLNPIQNVGVICIDTPISYMAFSPDGKYLACCCSQYIRMYAFDSKVEAKAPFCGSLSINGNGTLIRFYKDIHVGRALGLRSLQFSPNSQEIVAVSLCGKIIRVHWEKGSCDEAPNAFAYSAHFTASGNNIVAVDRAYSGLMVYVAWSLHKKQEREINDQPGLQLSATSADGKYLATADTRRVKIRDAKDFSVVRYEVVVDTDIQHVTFMNQSNKLLVVTHDRIEICQPIDSVYMAERNTPGEKQDGSSSKPVARAADTASTNQAQENERAVKKQKTEKK